MIQHEGKLNIVTYADSLLRWAHEGFSEVGDTGGMGIGSTVSAVLSHKGTYINL